MKKTTRLLAFILACFMLSAVLVACNNNTGDDPEETVTDKDGNVISVDKKPSGSNDETGEDQTGGEEATVSALDVALGKVYATNPEFFAGETFNILSREGIEKSFEQLEMTGEPLEDAVCQRNEEFVDTFGVEISVTSMAADALLEHFKADVKSSETYDYFFSHTNYNVDLAVQGYLYNFLDLEPYIDLSQSWWDKGTQSFNIADSIWFMNGSFNYDDDATTYCLMFNKDLAETYHGRKDLFYELVNEGKWTLDNFYNAAKIASKNTGDPEWNEKDQYGFVTTWEYGTTFFYGSDLNYIKCEEGKPPRIVLNENTIKKATTLLEKLQTIYGKEVTYWPAGGLEQVGKDIFWGGRCLFFGEIVENVVESNKQMDADFGVLPVPKYDEYQDNYISWTHGISSSMTIANHVDDVEKFGLLLEGFNVLSEKYVRPAYYDVVLTRKSVQDADSGPMLDIIFKGRTYDLAMYYQHLGLVEAFKTCVNEGKTSFSTEYGKVKQSAQSYLRKLNTQFSNLSKS